ncbi:MAG TPA: hypothetical protein VK680_10660 [Solirubrobacteraceae bacterium]|nr:hypothetical protein [Solirubrobacteraceae bacterium]
MASTERLYTFRYINFDGSLSRANVILESAPPLSATAEPETSKLADALRAQQETIATQAESARVLSSRIAEFDGDHPELSTPAS